MKKIHAVSLVLVASTLIALNSCWIPENFKVNVTVNKDGGYTFIYDGTLMYAPTVAAANKGELTQEDTEAGEKELREESGIKKILIISDLGEHYDTITKYRR